MSKYDNGAQAIRNLDRLLVEFPAHLAREVVKVAFDYTALAKKRVQGSGLDEDEKPFGIYADSTQKYKERKNRTSTPFPYVNFTDTGAMLRNTRPVVEEITKDQVVVRIAPTVNREIDKMRHLEESFGGIMKPTKKEKNLISRNIVFRINKLFTKYNLK